MCRVQPPEAQSQIEMTGDVVGSPTFGVSNQEGGEFAQFVEDVSMTELSTSSRQGLALPQLAPHRAKGKEVG